MSDYKIRQQSVVEQLSITERRLFNTLDRLREEIDVALPIASPRMYVARYVNDLDGEARTATLAREVAAEADEAGLTANGAAPSAVAAGCVYEAFVAALAIMAASTFTGVMLYFAGVGGL